MSQTTAATDAAGINIRLERENQSPFQQMMGYLLVAWERDHAVVDYEIRPDHLNRTGRLHGGVLASLLDTACGYAGVFCDEPGARRATVTLTLSVNFVAAVNAGRLSVAARRTGGGRSIFFADATVHDGEGRLIATASGSFKYLADPPPAR